MEELGEGCSGERSGRLGGVMREVAVDLGPTGKEKGEGGGGGEGNGEVG